jgi:hypothetical protein
VLDEPPTLPPPLAPPAAVDTLPVGSVAFPPHPTTTSERTEPTNAAPNVFIAERCKHLSDRAKHADYALRCG